MLNFTKPLLKHFYQSLYFIMKYQDGLTKLIFQRFLSVVRKFVHKYNCVPSNVTAAVILLLKMFKKYSRMCFFFRSLTEQSIVMVRNKLPYESNIHYCRQNICNNFLSFLSPCTDK